MADEPEDLRTLKEKALFYTTAFFVLLGTFSLFAFLFLVPFVIDPAFTTIFMQFDTNAAFCVTVNTEHFKGAPNCSWTSCREGCTKEVYECTQIRVNYKIWKPSNSSNETVDSNIVDEISVVQSKDKTRVERAIIPDYEYSDNIKDSEKSIEGVKFMDYSEESDLALMGNDSSWFFTGARLFPK